jgi:hypothetical protein
MNASQPRRRWRGLGGNRGVPPRLIRRVPGDMRGRQAAVHLEREGGSWGKHGFPHGTERPKAAEDDAWAAGEDGAT